jgi:seryl-tRNA synthetase
MIEDMRTIDRKEEELRAELTPKQDELQDLLYRIPNPPCDDVTRDTDASHNEVIRTVGEIPAFTFAPRDHMELGDALGIIDIDRAAKVSGARFTYLKGDGALLEFALLQYGLSVIMKHGFVPVLVPHLITANSMRAMGYLEHGGHDEIYYLQKDNLYLIGTAEQAIGPMHQDEILDLSQPIRYVGFSPCYRRESGSYGKDTKGILRMHQFEKLEMFSFTTPETSDAEHELILSIEEELMQGLKLPYHVIKMVSGDLGLPAARKYDIEAWVPSQNTYRETHSTSTTTDFQTRRLNTRYRTEDGKTAIAHALNGTAFAMGRTLIAILENNQQEDGSVVIPEVLRPFMGKDMLTPKK